MLPQNPILSSWPHIQPNHISGPMQRMTWMKSSIAYLRDLQVIPIWTQDWGPLSTQSFPVSLQKYLLIPLSSHTSLFLPPATLFVHSLDQPYNKSSLIPYSVALGAWETLNICMNQDDALYPHGGCSLRTDVHKYERQNKLLLKQNIKKISLWFLGHECIFHLRFLRQKSLMKNWSVWRLNINLLFTDRHY